MWRSKSFTKKTRKGKVVKVVKEHYLRDDIGCGSDVCALCPADGMARLSNTPHSNQYLLLDTNVVLNQMDLLEKDVPPLCDIIIPQTVLQEVKHRSLGVYNRLHALLRVYSRRIFVFSNEHHRQTYIDRMVIPKFLVSFSLFNLLFSGK